MKKVVFKVDLPDEKAKMKIMKRVSGMAGIESISMDMKEKKLTVTGDVDPVSIAGQLRKHYLTEIISVGPAKESKESGDKQKGVKVDGQKKGEEKKKDVKSDVSELVKAYQAYTPEYKSYYYVKAEDESPNACTIC